MSYAMQSTQSNQMAAAGSLAPQQPRLVTLGERFERSLAEFQNLNTTLRNIAERTLGAIPETVSKDVQGGPGPATVGRLEAYQQAFDDMLTRLGQTISRLDSL